MRWLRLALFPVVSANVEKVVFKAPAAVTVPQTQPSLDALCLDILTPAYPIISTALPVAFPSEQSPRGKESWYLIRGLTEGQRHEVRACWAAIQPTDFWLDTFTLQETFERPDLVAALADFSEARAKQGNCDPRGKSDQPRSSLAFLRIQAAASFYSTNGTLMRHPPDVQVDIILDPYLLSILPRSLAPTGIYLVIIAASSWLLSGRVWSFLSKVGATKQRTD